MSILPVRIALDHFQKELSGAADVVDAIIMASSMPNGERAVEAFAHPCGGYSEVRKCAGEALRRGKVRPSEERAVAIWPAWTTDANDSPRGKEKKVNTAHNQLGIINGEWTKCPGQRVYEASGSRPSTEGLVQ